MENETNRTPVAIASIHSQIEDQLKYFCTNNQVPNILFHGPPGSGKKTLLEGFLQNIYKHNKENMQKYVICVNCAHAHGKGIKFIREELKFFAKTHIHNNGGHFFKSIVLTNGDKLTTDAQSALRRCIEMFTFNTRFFIVVEDKYRLLKPILSRFCEIYVPFPPFSKNAVLFSPSSKHAEDLKDEEKNKEENTKEENTKEVQRRTWLVKEIVSKMREILASKKKESALLVASAPAPVTKKKQTTTCVLELAEFCTSLYEKGYCGLDVISLIEKNYDLGETITIDKRFELLIFFHKVRKEFRNEKLLLLFLFNFLFLDLETDMQTLSFMWKK